MVASVNGSLMMKVAPTPVVLWISIRPRSVSTFRRTTSMPIPRPDISVSSLAVEKPGRKISA